MKILYVVQATGNGHISRSREVIKALKKNGHDVRTIFSGRDPSHLWDIDDFKPYDSFKGFTFHTAKGKIQYLATARDLSPIAFFKDIATYDAKDFDLAIVDFEPVTARIAKRNKLPSIGIGHQYAFIHPVPISHWDPMALMVLKKFAPVEYPLGLHWHHFDQPILPPIIPHMSTNNVKNDPQKVLVYLPMEDRDEVKDLFKPHKNFHFYYYTSVENPVDEENIHLRPFSREGFLNDLMDCGGVICNAGFELASEALHIGKKLLVRPLVGQIEQTSNALALTQLNLGTSMMYLEPDIVKNWLHKPSLKPLKYPDVAGTIAEWIGTGNWENYKELADRLWSEIEPFI